ncbi:MAG: hypothetical protein AMJ81_12105 [Phycisphaerae bacterium SM23_33]|jgi:putative Mg2+ transporter-C (MgtC) family protein|nr:MAG: hypothetical protein AMJ81_12105 [Phycisphaerae bacterium SM23_33]
MPAASILESWQFQGIVRLLIAAVLGALIGLEREHHGRAAGLRTHLLVALGAAMAMLVSLNFGYVFGRGGGGTAIQVDPARVAYGVMGGIGFIGAGAIIHYGVGVRGLTTAASLWCCAAIGLAAGFGMHVTAIAATVIVLFALVILDFLERLIPARVSKNVTISVPGTSPEALARYRRLLTEGGAKVIGVDTTCDFKSNQSLITFRVSVFTSRFPQAIGRLRDGAPEITRMTVE